MRSRLGLERARELVVGSPYDFREQALLYVPRTMPDPRSDGYTERAAEEVVVAARALRGARARAHVELPRARRAPRSRPRAGAVRGARAGRGAARAAARALPRRGRLGAARDVDVLAGRGRARRVAVAARDRQAPVLRAGRPAARGALRGGRGGRRRLVQRLRAADRGAPAPTGLRPPDPRPRRPRRRRDPRPSPADEGVRPRVPRRAAALPGRRRPCRGRRVLRWGSIEEIAVSA